MARALAGNLFETFASNPALNFLDDADGAGQLALKPGSYTLYASRGLEYTIGHAEFDIVAGEDSPPLGLVIEQVVGADDNLVSVDPHVHGGKSYDASTPLSSRVLSYAAAGVEIMIATDHDYVTDYAPVITSLALDGEIRSIVGVESTGVLPVPAHPPDWDEMAFPQGLGHTGAWPMAVIEGARRNGAIQDEYVNPGTLYDRLRGASTLPLLGAMPDTATLDQWLAAIHAGEPGTLGENLPPHNEIVVLNHPREGNAGLVEIGLLKTLGGSGYDPHQPIDSPRNELMLLPSLFHEDHVGADGTHTDGLSFDAVELINGKVISEYEVVREDWFSLLNQGYYKTGIAASDSHRTVLEAPGIGRTYVRFSSPDPLTMDLQELVNNVKSMQAIGTTGPMLYFGVPAANQGEVPARFTNVGDTVVATSATVPVSIRVEAPNWIPVEEIRLYWNGSQLCSIDIADENVIDGPIVRFDQMVTLGDNLIGDGYLTAEAGIKLLPDGTPVSPENLETMRKIYPDVSHPFAFTNPIFIDRDGAGGYVPPGLSPDDKDGDGLSAVLEFALGSSDDDPSSGHGLVTVSPTADGTSFIVTYQKNLAAIMTFSLEVSRDLVHWTDVDDDFELLSETPNGDGTATVSVRWTGPPVAGGDFHVRLRIICPQ